MMRTGSSIQHPLDGFKTAVLGSLVLFWILQLAFIEGWFVGGVRVSVPWSGLFLLSFVWLGFRIRDARRGAGPLWTGGNLLLLCLTVFLSTFRWHGADDLAISLIPFALLKHGTLYLDAYSGWFAGTQINHVIQAGPHLASFYPLLGSFLALPVYFLPVLSGAEPTDQILHQLQKCAAVFITSGTVWFLFNTYAKRLPARKAFGLALVYALGTNAFSLCSQSLWQHGASCLALAGALWALDEEKWTLLGFFSVLAVAGRSTNLIFFVPLAGSAILIGKKRGAVNFTLGALLPGLLLLLYWNLILLTGRPGDVARHSTDFHTPSLIAMAGLLVGPFRGLLWFSPVVFFGVWGAFRRLLDPGLPAGKRLSAALLTGGVFGSFLLFSSFACWWGAYSWGPRFLIESATVLFFFIPDVMGPIEASRLRKRLWSASVALSIVVHGWGAYNRWRSEVWAEKNLPDSLWSLKSHPLLYPFLR